MMTPFPFSRSQILVSYSRCNGKTFLIAYIDFDYSKPTFFTHPVLMSRAEDKSSQKHTTRLLFRHARRFILYSRAVGIEPLSHSVP